MNTLWNSALTRGYLQSDKADLGPVDVSSNLTWTCTTYP